MMAEADVRRRMVELEGLTAEAFTEVVLAAALSIVEGSPVTGAPGQPVESGALKESWRVEQDAPLVATISSDLPYAGPIEDGVGRYGPMQLRSAVGGFHSLSLTIAGMERLVDQVVATRVRAHP